jgi:adenine phosphoribosyltransferase
METAGLCDELEKVILPLPFKGIERFYDISGLLANPVLFSRTVDALFSLVREEKPDYICALDSRGFIIGSPIAYSLKIPLIMIRKGGKLPGVCNKVEFGKEYDSTDTFEIQAGAIRGGSTVVVIDDVVATGGSLKGAFDLIRGQGALKIRAFCLLDLELPGSRELLKENEIQVASLLTKRNCS